MARNDGSAPESHSPLEKGSRANARFIVRKLASAEQKMREAMAELDEAAEAVEANEDGAQWKVADFTDLRSATRIIARSTSALQLSWGEYEQSRIKS